MTHERLSRGSFVKLASLLSLVPVVSACERILAPTEQSLTEKTILPTLTSTLQPTEPSIPIETPTPTPTETPTPSATPTPEIYDWNFVSTRSDEQIFQVIGTPNPKEYSLEIELSPHKILRNEGGASYALFQNSEGIVFLAQNLETRTIEHAVFAEYEGGVPLLILTGQDVAVHDNGWYQLNQEYGLTEARDRLAHAFNRALSMRWWITVHPNDGTNNPRLPYGKKDWLGEIPGFSNTEFLQLTRYQRTYISDYIFELFINSINDSRMNYLPLNVRLTDRNQTDFNAANELMVIKTVIAESNRWDLIWEHYNDWSHREASAERNGRLFTLSLSQPSFSPYREPGYIGGTIAHFFRYFFGSSALYLRTDLGSGPGEHDMTGPILEDLCRLDSLPADILNRYNNIYPAMLNFGHSEIQVNTCAVVFGH